MTDYRLDELADALHSTLRGSQEKIDRQNEERLKKVIHLDSQGDPESLNWECRLPAGDGSERNISLLRMPWESLEQTQAVNISELSIELNCKIKKTARRKEGQKPPLTATPIPWDESKEETHRIKLSASLQQPETTVSIDGTSVESYIDEQLSAEQQDIERPREKHHKLTIVLVLILLILGLIALLIYFYFFPFPKI